MPNEQPACRCGCGETPSPGSNWPPGGHDHRALLQRVALIGNTAEFCDWFDQTFQQSDACTSACGTAHTFSGSCSLRWMGPAWEADGERWVHNEHGDRVPAPQVTSTRTEK